MIMGKITIRKQIVYGGIEFDSQPQKIANDLSLYISLDESFAIIVDEDDEVLFELEARNGDYSAIINEISNEEDDD